MLKDIAYLEQLFWQSDILRVEWNRYRCIYSIVIENKNRLPNRADKYKNYNLNSFLFSYHFSQYPHNFE